MKNEQIENALLHDVGPIHGMSREARVELQKSGPRFSEEQQEQSEFFQSAEQLKIPDSFSVPHGPGLRAVPSHPGTPIATSWGCQTA